MSEGFIELSVKSSLAKLLRLKAGLAIGEMAACFNRYSNRQDTVLQEYHLSLELITGN